MASGTNVSTNVSLGKPKVGGSVYMAPIGTALPTNSYSELSADYVCCGYISEDGVTNSRSIDSEEKKAWGGDVVYSAQTGRADTWQMAFIEAKNEAVMKLFNGDENVTGSLTSETGLVVTANNTVLSEHVYIIDMIMRADTNFPNGVPKRIVIPIGLVSATEDIVYKDDDVVAYGVTITGTPDTAGNTHYEYTGGIAA